MKKAIIVLLLLLAGCEANQSGTCTPETCRPTVRILAFTAEWCKPCKAAMPALLSMEADGIDIKIIDIDKFPSVARDYGITSIPCFVITDDNKTRKTSNISTLISIVKG